MNASRPFTCRYPHIGDTPVERHHALGRDATFPWSRAFTQLPRLNQTRHRVIRGRRGRGVEGHPRSTLPRSWRPSLRHGGHLHDVIYPIMLRILLSGSFCQIYRITDEALIAETAVWPNFFLMNVFFALKGSKLFIIIDYSPNRHDVTYVMITFVLGALRFICLRFSYVF